MIGGGVFVATTATAIVDARQEAHDLQFGQEGDEQAQMLEVLELGADGQLFEVRARADDPRDVVRGEAPLWE